MAQDKTDEPWFGLPPKPVLVLPTCARDNEHDWRPAYKGTNRAREFECTICGLTEERDVS